MIQQLYTGGWGRWRWFARAGRNLRICPEGLSMCIPSFRKTQDTHCMWEYKQSAEKRETCKTGTKNCKTGKQHNFLIRRKWSFFVRISIKPHHIYEYCFPLPCHLLLLPFCTKLTSIIPFTCIRVQRKHKNP